MMDVFRRSRRHSRAIWLILLAAVAILLRVIRAAQEVVANPDTMRYIDQAKGLAVNPIATLRGEVYHPLHAAMALVAYQGTHLVIANERMAWLWALRVVGIVAATVVTLEIVWLGRLLGAPFWAGICAAAAWLVGRRTSIYGSDGLSDMLAIALFGGAMLTGLHALRWLPKRGCEGFARSRVDWRWLLAGVFAGLSYLTRPEGMAAVVILLCSLLFLCTGRRKAGWMESWKVFPRRRLVALGAFQAGALLVAGAIVVALPYMLVTHRITGKVEIPAAILVAQAQSTPIEVFPHIVRELFETFFWPCTIVFCLAMVWRPKLWGRPRLRVPVILWCVVWTGVMAAVLLWPGKRYLDGRHTLPLQLLLFAMLGLAIAAWEVPMRWWMDSWRKNPELWERLPRYLRWRHWPRTFALCVVGCMLIPGIVEFMLPPRADKANLVAAAKWIEANTRPEVVVCDHERLVGFYSMHPYAQWFGTAGKPELHQLAAAQDKYAVSGRPAPVVAGEMYELGSGDVPPAAIGSYRAIAAFRSGAANDRTHDHLYVLYALPGEQILKEGSAMMPAKALSALGVSE
jgi:hypothetical protein